MLKTLKILFYINISFCLFLIITACTLQSISYYALPPFWQGVHQAMFNGVENVSDFEIGVFVGRLIIPTILPILGLIAVKKKSYKLSMITLVAYILVTLGSIGNGRPYIFGIITIVLLLTKPVRNYFKVN